MGRHDQKPMDKGPVPLTLLEQTAAGEEQGVNVKGHIADTQNQKG